MTTRNVAAWLCGLMLTAAGCSGPASGPAPETPATPVRGGTMIMGSITDIDAWNEYVAHQAISGIVLRRIYLPLARGNGDYREHPQTYTPLLAESWKHSEDGLELTFRLREASWSDGTPVAAQDVVFTWEAQTSADVAWDGAGAKSRITSVEALDERTVRFRFDAPYPYQLADAVDGGILPRHVFGAVPFEQWTAHDWSAARIGSGPFLLERHDAGHEIVLRRNPSYYLEEFPRLDEVVIRVVPDASNLLTQLLSGDIDYMENVAPRDAAALGGNVTVVAFDYPKYDFLGWNGSRPPFDDPMVRRAMTLAIDRQALVDDLLYGHGVVGKGPVLSFRWAVDRTLEAWPYDPAEARRILAAAGYATDENPGGRPLEFELLTNSGNTLREAMLVKIQEQLSRIGVSAEVQMLEGRAVRQRVVSGDYDGYLGGWFLTGKFELTALFGSDESMNIVSYHSPEIDGLLERLDRAAGFEEMKPVLDAIQRRIHEDQPYTFLYENKRLAVHGPRLEGVEINNPTDPLAALERFWIDR